MKETNLIEKLKIAIIYGNRIVDGEMKDGVMEKIYRDDDDTAHYFYIKEFLENHLKNEEEVQAILSKKNNDVNSIFYEIQKLGHIVFAENTSNLKHKSGIFYIPKNLTNNQKQTLATMKNQLEIEDYNILTFFNLYRNQEGALLGKQMLGKATILESFIKEKEEER